MANGNQEPDKDLIQGASRNVETRRQMKMAADAALQKQETRRGARETADRMLSRGRQAADQLSATREPGPVAGAGSLPSGTEEEMRQQALNAATNIVADTVDALSDGTTASKALEKRAEQEGEQDFGSILLNALGGFVTGFATVYTGKDFLNPYLSTQAERRKEAAARIGKFEKLAMVIQGAEDPAQVEQDVLKVLGMEGASPEVIEEVVGRMTSEDADFLLGEVYKKRDARLKEAGDEAARLQNARDQFRMAGLGEPSQDATADEMINAVGANERKKEEEAKSRSKYSADSNEALNNLRTIPVADNDLFEDAVNQAEARIAPEYRGQFRDSVDSLRAARVETLKNQQLEEADTHIKGRTFQKGYSQHTQPQKTRIDGELKRSYDEAQTFLESEDELQRMVDSKLISQESAEKIKELVGGTMLDKGYAEWAAGASGEDLNLFLQHFGREGDLLQQIRAAKQGLPLLDDGLESLNETLSATGLGITLNAEDVNITRDGEIIPKATVSNKVYEKFSAKVMGTEDVKSLEDLKSKARAYYGQLPPELSSEIDSRMSVLTVLKSVTYEADAVPEGSMTQSNMTEPVLLDYTRAVMDESATEPLFSLTDDVFKPDVQMTIEEIDSLIEQQRFLMEQTRDTGQTEIYENAQQAYTNLLQQRIVAETTKTQTTVRNFQRDLATDMADGEIRLDLVASPYGKQGPLGEDMEGMAAFSDSVQNAASFNDIAEAYYTSFIPQVGVQVANTERGRSNAEAFYADAMDKHHEISDEAILVLDKLDDIFGSYGSMVAAEGQPQEPVQGSGSLTAPGAAERRQQAQDILVQQARLDRIQDPEKLAEAKLKALGVPYPEGGVVKFMGKTGQKLLELPLAEMSNEDLADYAAFYLMNR